MRKLAIAATASVAIWSATAHASTLQISSELFNETYSPTDLQSLIVNGNSNSIGGGGAFLQLNTGGSREVAIEDSVASAGSLAGFDQVRFDFSIDYLGQGETFGNFGNNDKDLFVGIHDGDHHFSVFSNETVALNVFGDAYNPGAPGDDLAVGVACGATPATCVRQVGVDPSYNASGYSASILLDSNGTGRLTVNGFESALMDLNLSNEMFFFIGRDQTHESYRLQSASVTVTGITINASEPGALGIALGGGLMALWASRRRRK